MQNHTAELTWALDRRSVIQTVLTTSPLTAPLFSLDWVTTSISAEMLRYR
jgi:hypothetical protein